MKQLADVETKLAVTWGRVFLKVLDTTDAFISGLETDAIRLDTLGLLKKLSAKEEAAKEEKNAEAK